MSYSLNQHGKPDEKAIVRSLLFAEEKGRSRRSTPALLLTSLDPSMAWRTQVQVLIKVD
jgi:hypothetical protein